MRAPLTLEFYFLVPSDGCRWLVKFLCPGVFREDPFPAACFLWRSLRDAPGLVLSPVAAVLPAAVTVFLPYHLPIHVIWLCAWSAQPTPTYPTSSRGGGLPSISPGNAWLRQDGAPQPGWCSTARVVSGQWSSDKEESKSSDQRLNFSSVRTLEKCLSIRDNLLLVKTSQTLPWPASLNWVLDKVVCSLRCFKDVLFFDILLFFSQWPLSPLEAVSSSPS